MTSKSRLVCPILLWFVVSVGLVTPEVLAQEEMVPEWTYENGAFSEIAISADGRYVAAGAAGTGEIYLLRGGELLWSYLVGSMCSISLSQRGEHLAVGTDSALYLFGRDASDPMLIWSLEGDYSIVVVSSDGGIVVVGSTAKTYHEQAESTLDVFEVGQSLPFWTITLEGVLESLSICDDGSHFAASTSLPGVLNLFSVETKLVLWRYDLGDWGGGARISNDASYVVAVGGDGEGGEDNRVLRFSIASPNPRYAKLISTPPSQRGLSLNANGSIFAVSYEGSNEFTVFDMNVQPYGPDSVHSTLLSSTEVAMTMSLDGRYIFLGTSGGVCVYEYWKNALSLERQYTSNSPSIFDIAASADGRYVVAAGQTDSPDGERASLLFFDIFCQTDGLPDTGGRYGRLALAAGVVVAGVVVVVLYRKKIMRRFMQIYETS
jgi:WD40 repeat protein